jgi:hypothetical protein
MPSPSVVGPRVWPPSRSRLDSNILNAIDSRRAQGRLGTAEPLYPRIMLKQVMLVPLPSSLLSLAFGWLATRSQRVEPARSLFAVLSRIIRF